MATSRCFKLPASRARSVECRDQSRALSQDWNAAVVNVERRLVDSFWGLRDDAYDHPERWEGVTPGALFQRLAEHVEEAEERGEPIDWRGVAVQMIDWRVGESSG